LDDHPGYINALKDLNTNTHRLEVVTDWFAHAAVNIGHRFWGLAFIDNAREARAGCLLRLKNRARIIVIHDTDQAEWYGLDDVLTEFPYRVDCTWFEKHTTVVSMTDPLEGLKELL
jgi:hypothetical protein